MARKTVKSAPRDYLVFFQGARKIQNKYTKSWHGFYGFSTAVVLGPNVMLSPNVHPGGVSITLEANTGRRSFCPLSIEDARKHLVPDPVFCTVERLNEFLDACEKAAKDVQAGTSPWEFPSKAV